MKEELQSKLVEILTSIQTAAGKASDFALSQLPDIAQSYIVYGRATATFIFVVCLLGAGLAAFVAVKYGFLNKEAVYKEPNHYMHGDWLGARVAAAVGGSMVTVFMSVLVMVESPELMLVWFAPKVWLLKELAHFLK